MNMISAAKAAPKRIFLLLTVFWIFLISPSVLSAEENSPPVLTFKEFYQKVSDYYPKLKQQDADVELALARKLQALSGFLPNLQLGASIVHGDEPVHVFGALLREENFRSEHLAMSRLNSPSPHTTYTANITGQIPIFDAMQTILRVRAAKLHVESAEYEAAFTRMEAFLLAAEAYQRAVSIEQSLATVHEVSQASEEDVRQAEDLKDKGLILGADFFTAKVALGQINQLKNQLTQRRLASHILMNILMGEDPLQEFVIEVRSQALSPDDRTLPGWLETAYASRPDLAAVDQVVEAQKIEISRERSTFLPRVAAFGEGRQDTDELAQDGGRNYLIGVRGKIDLFDPSYPSRVRGAKETLKKLEYDRMMLKDSISRDVTNEFAYYQAARDNLPVILNMLEDAGQAVDLTLPLYREGRKSIADLLAIRSSYLNTAREFFNLAADSKISWTRLLFLSGQLDEPAINETINTIGE